MRVIGRSSQILKGGPPAVKAKRQNEGYSRQLLAEWIVVLTASASFSEAQISFFAIDKSSAPAPLRPTKGIQIARLGRQSLAVLVLES